MTSVGTARQSKDEEEEDTLKVRHLPTLTPSSLASSQLPATAQAMSQPPARAPFYFPGPQALPYLFMNSSQQIAHPPQSSSITMQQPLQFNQAMHLPLPLPFNPYLSCPRIPLLCMAAADVVAFDKLFDFARALTLFSPIPSTTSPTAGHSAYTTSIWHQ